MRNKSLFCLTILCLLALSIIATIYMTWLAYPFISRLFNLSAIVYMPSREIESNFNQLMLYLVNPFSHTLSLPDFRSSTAGLKHFAQVKFLFLLAEMVMVGTIPFALWFRKTIVLRKKLWLFYYWLKGLIILPFGLIFIVFLMGFNQFFILFHHLLFRDNNWLFNPQKDPVILILPEGLFFLSFLIFLVFYEMGMAILYLKSRKEFLAYAKK